MIENIENQQAAIFGHYLIGQPPAEHLLERFIEALHKTTGTLTAEDQKILRFVIRWPGSLSFVDAGLAILKPHCEIRRRLYLMFAILEASPQYWRYFLPIERKKLYGLVILGIGLRAVFRTICGVVLVKVLYR